MNIGSMLGSFFRNRRVNNKYYQCLSFLNNGMREEVEEQDENSTMLW